MDNPYRTSEPTDEIADYTRERQRRRSMDAPFLLLVLILMTIGLIMLLSASYARAYYEGSSPVSIFIRQLFFAAVGLVLMMLLSRLPLSIYKKWSMRVLLIAVALMLLVTVVGTRANGAKRWINLGLFTIQPSEFAKIGVIMAFSAMICKYRDKMKTWRYGVLPFAGVLIAFAGLLALEPHLSATIIITLLGAALMFLGGSPMSAFLAGGAGLAGLIFLYTNFSYASDRIEAWRNPMTHESDTAYQIKQSLYSIGSGGLSGVGFGESRQKYMFLPEEHNDFIFSIVCEELGYIGAMTILILFALLIVRGFWLATKCPDRYAFLLCCGVSTLLSIQVILNVSVVTNLIPCTGVSLPFFSYGGTALMLQLAEMGIVLSCSRTIPDKKKVMTIQNMQI